MNTILCSQLHEDNAINGEDGVNYLHCFFCNTRWLQAEYWFHLSQEWSQEIRSFWEIENMSEDIGLADFHGKYKYINKILRVIGKKQFVISTQ